jgi:two-component system, chemotaxis family, protein-glutamate methylesterase/glutaminase
VDSILAEQSEVLEEALWAALKTLEESANLSRLLRGQILVAQRFEEKLQQAERHAVLIHQLLIKVEPVPTAETTTNQPVGE